MIGPLSRSMAKRSGFYLHGSVPAIDPQACCTINENSYSRKPSTTKPESLKTLNPKSLTSEPFLDALFQAKPFQQILEKPCGTF